MDFFDIMPQENYYFLINSLEGGGAERVIINFANALAKQGKNIYVICLKKANFYDLPQGIHYVSLSGVKSNFLMFLFIPWYVWKFKKAFKKYFLSKGMSSLEVANFVHILSRKDANIAFETNISYFSGIIGVVFRFLIRWLYPKAHKIKVNSEENRYDIATYLHVDQNRIVTIYNPVDVYKIQEKMQEPIPSAIQQKTKNKKIFITVGRLIKSKNYGVILDSFKYIYDHIDSNFVYFIAGNGPERRWMQHKILSYGLKDNVILLGAQKNVFKYLNVSNYFVYASQVEGFPNALIEAMACNLPIITSDFKTGAKECILGSGSSYAFKNIQYPYFGPNGVLLNLASYQKDFIQCYGHLNKIRQEKQGFEKFDIKKVSDQILKFIG